MLHRRQIWVNNRTQRLTIISVIDNISRKVDMFFMSKNQKVKVLALLKAVGNPVRLDILRFLISGEQCVCNIFDHLGLSQNLVSHHLGILRKNNLIMARKNGRWVHYSINPKEFSCLKDFVCCFSFIKNNKSFNC